MSKNKLESENLSAEQVQKINKYVKEIEMGVIQKYSRAKTQEIANMVRDQIFREIELSSILDQSINVDHIIQKNRAQNSHLFIVDEQNEVLYSFSKEAIFNWFGKFGNLFGRKNGTNEERETSIKTEQQEVSAKNIDRSDFNKELDTSVKTIFFLAVIIGIATIFGGIILSNIFIFIFLTLGLYGFATLFMVKDVSKSWLNISSYIFLIQLYLGVSLSINYFYYIARFNRNVIVDPESYFDEMLVILVIFAAFYFLITFWRIFGSLFVSSGNGSIIKRNIGRGVFTVVSSILGTLVITIFDLFLLTTVEEFRSDNNAFQLLIVGILFVTTIIWFFLYRLSSKIIEKSYLSKTQLNSIQSNSKASKSVNQGDQNGQKVETSMDTVKSQSSTSTGSTMEKEEKGAKINLVNVTVNREKANQYFSYSPNKTKLAISILVAFLFGWINQLIELRFNGYDLDIIFIVISLGGILYIPTIILFEFFSWRSRKGEKSYFNYVLLHQGENREDDFYNLSADLEQSKLRAYLSKFILNDVVELKNRRVQT